MSRSTDSLPKNSLFFPEINDFKSFGIFTRLDDKRREHQPVAYVDFAKAFDSVSHNKLLLKLSGYCICGTLLESRHMCQIKVGAYLSNPLPISTGVIQGSCLGPLLFVIFVNDISNIFQMALLSSYLPMT